MRAVLFRFFWAGSFPFLFRFFTVSFPFLLPPILFRFHRFFSISFPVLFRFFPYVWCPNAHYCKSLLINAGSTVVFRWARQSLWRPQRTFPDDLREHREVLSQLEPSPVLYQFQNVSFPFLYRFFTISLPVLYRFSLQFFTGSASGSFPVPSKQKNR